MPPSNLLLASKVVIVEEPPRIRNIPGVETSITAFVGIFERGPVLTATFATSFAEAVDIYGGFIASSDAMLAIEAFFRNGGTACWITRVVHYTDITDSATLTAVRGQQNLLDRGGSPAAAFNDSADGPFNLEPGEVLEVDIDNTGPDALTLTSVYAVAASGANETYALSNGETLDYQVKLPGQTVLEELKTITFLTADFAAIGTATAQEVVNVINRDGIGIKAVLLAGPSFEIRSTKRGSDASLVIDAGSTSIANLSLVSGTTNGSGNVADISVVTATELAGLLTALPLGAGTATVVGNKLRLTGVTTGPTGEVEITASTTALGIFAGVLPITVFGTNALEVNTILVEGKDPGTYIANFSITIENATSGNADEFNLTIKEGTSLKEIFPNLGMDDSLVNYFEDVVNGTSQFIQLTDLNSPATSPSNLPKLGVFSTWVNQDDGLTGLLDTDFTGSDAGGTGFFALDLISNLSILTVPGRATSAVHNAMITYCEIHRVGTCMAILDPPENLTAQQMKTYVETTAAIGGLSEFAAIYWPRVEIQNPNKTVFGATDNIIVAPSGHIAGVYARVDQSQLGGVYTPPAGIENGILFGVLGFETDEVLDERKRDVIYPSLINPLTSIDGSPRHIDGSRTLKSNGDFPTIGERRGVIFIQQSLKIGLLFAKHRKNNRALRMEVKRTITAFLLRQFDVGAFRGDTPNESFKVDVSDAVNTAAQIFAGQLIALIGLATQKPAEFIILKFSQDTRELEERLANETN